MNPDLKLIPLPRPVAELSDAELEKERERRRAARADRGVSALPDPLGNGAVPEGRVARALAAQDRDRSLAQHYARLELEPGASMADIERKYTELRAKYDPAKFKKDPGKLAVATELSAELEKSHTALVNALR